MKHNVVGLNIEEAINILKKDKVKYEIVKKISFATKRGTVIKVDTTGNLSVVYVSSFRILPILLIIAFLCLIAYFTNVTYSHYKKEDSQPVEKKVKKIETKKTEETDKEDTTKSVNDVVNSLIVSDNTNTNNNVMSKIVEKVITPTEENNTVINDSPTKEEKILYVDYTITYDLKGGNVVEGNPTTFNQLTETFTLNNPVKDGYTFDGWTTEDNSNLDVNVVIPNGSTGNKKFIANYTPVEYTITYDLDGGTLPVGIVNSTSYNIETDDFVLNEPELEDYIFVGWSGTGLNAPTKNLKIEKGSKGNKEFKANYVIKKFKINLDSNGGNKNSSVVVTTKTLDLDTTNFEMPTKQVKVSFDKSTVTGASFGITTDKYTTVKPAAYCTDITCDKQLIFVRNNGLEIMPNIANYTDSTGYIKEDDITLYAYYNEPEKISLPSVTKEGYVCGWTEEGTNALFIDEYIPTSENVTLKAICNQNTYKVKLVLDGGTYQNNTNDFEINGNYKETINLSAPQKDGYNFTGWTLVGNGTLTDLDNNGYQLYTFSSSNATLIATYEEKSYNLIVNLNGGKVSNSDANLEYYGKKDSVVNLPTPTIDDGEFVSWVDNTAGTINRNNYVFGSEDDGIKATYNKHKKISYLEYYGTLVVTHDLVNDIPTINVKLNNGGSLIEKILVKPNDTFTLKASSGGRYSSAVLTLKNGNDTVASASGSATRTYTYTGDKPVEMVLIVSGTNASGSVVITDKDGVYYNYISETPVSFTYENGSYVNEYTTFNGTLKKYYEVGKSFDFLPVPTRNGYTFAGWYTNSEFTGDKVDEDTIVTSNMNLYGKWNANSYGLTVDPNGGVWNSSNDVQSFNQNMDTTMEIPAPTRNGYEFTGWILSGNGTITSNNPLQSATQTFTFKNGATSIVATYKVLKSTVTVDPNGGDYNGILTKTDQQGNTLILTTPQREGYDFTGWIVDSGNGSVDGNTYTFGSSDTVVRATYNAKTFKLTYDLDGGEYAERFAEADIVYDQKYQILSDPTKEGYIFNGWEISGSGELTHKEPYAILTQTLRAGNGNTTLKATWVEEYKILKTTEFKANKFFGVSVGRSGHYNSFLTMRNGKARGYITLSPGDVVTVTINTTSTSNTNPTDAHIEIKADDNTVFTKSYTALETDIVKYTNETDHDQKLDVYLYGTNNAGDLIATIRTVSSNGARYKADYNN